jgi:hypothetical protein
MDAWVAGPITRVDEGATIATTSPTKEIGTEEQMTRSLINDPSPFISIPTELKPSRWAKWFEGGEPLTSLVSECLDYVVDFQVRETAEAKARRVWKMEPKDETHRATEETL